MNILKLFMGIGACLLMQKVSAQDTTNVLLHSKIPSGYVSAVSKKVDNIENGLDKKSKQVLEKYKKYESRLLKKLSKADSNAAKSLLSESESKYNELQRRLKTSRFQQYIPGLDTATNSLKFLKQMDLGNNLKDVDEALGKIKDLEAELQKAENIKQFLKERRQMLKEQLEKLGFAKELKKLNKQVYYYSAQIKEYKEILNDPKKVEKKAIELLSKSKMFKEFMKKNSMLASLFRIPGSDPNDPGYIASLAGLQTRTQVNTLIQNRLSTPGAQQQFSNNLQQAKEQMQQLKNRIAKAGGIRSDDELPDFKPNSQKTKSFWKRLDIGTNIQTIRNNGLLPVTSDFGLSVGYKLNDKSIIGIGGSYKVGWGEDIQHIHITHQGASLRSFIDWKLKKGLWISGGYEMNYQAAFNTINQLKEINAWQHSGLMGLSKTFPIKTKVFKKTKMQLLWDFLSYQQRPVTQPIIFRIGYNL